MKYAIVYSSLTGNTKLLADSMREALPKQHCLYIGQPQEEALEARRLYVGFWTDRGDCDEKTRVFLEGLRNKEVFLFGTAGFVAGDYADQVLDKVQSHLDPSVKVIGRKLFQGKMGAAVRTKYEAMEDGPKKDMLLQNFDEALKHPSEQDLIEAQEMVKHKKK